MLVNVLSPINTSILDAPASGRGSPLLLLAMCLGVLVAMIDTSVVNLALAPIGAAFAAPVATLQWVLDAYNLVYAVLLLSGGLIADLYGRRRTFIVGSAMMAAASLVCTLAPDALVLIAGRAVAGVGAALLLPASLAIIRVAWPEPVARGRALGIWASCNGLAFVIGPTIGGLLIAHFGWRSVFFLIVPLAAAAAALAARAAPESADPYGRHFDLPGQLLGAAVLGGLALAAIMAREGGSAWVAGLITALLALPVFLHLEHRVGPGALIPLDLFRKPPFCGAMVATAAMTFGVYGFIFLLPLIWQSSGSFGPQAAGLALMPPALAFFLLSPRSGPLSERLGMRVMTAGGTALIGCGLLVLASTRAGQPLWLAEAGLVLAGLGMGLATGPLMAVAVGAVSTARSGTASALINVARMSGATIGVALLGTLFAFLGGGAVGLRAAMLAGGIIQLAGAATAYATIPSRQPSSPS